MALKTVIWCDGCKEQQFSGPCFEVKITRRQLLPRHETKGEEITLLLCEFNECYGNFMAALDGLTSNEFQRVMPTIELKFRAKEQARGPAAGGD